MVWRRAAQYAIALVTPRGTYHVSKGTVDRWGRTRYCAWPPAPPPIPGWRSSEPYRWQDHVHTMLGCFDDAESAKRCCEEHAGIPTNGT